HSGAAHARGLHRRAALPTERPAVRGGIDRTARGRSLAERRARTRVGARVGAPAGARTETRTGAAAGARTRDRVRTSVGARTRARTGAPLGTRTGTPVGIRTGAAAGARTGARLDRDPRVGCRRIIGSVQRGSRFHLRRVA